MPDPGEPTSSKPADWFVTTRWSLVLNAKADDLALAREAMELLCRTYWKPIHGYVRGREKNPTEAEDLTQQFFARFLEKGHVQLADRSRGRFRSFLLTSVKHFLVNEWERASAQKRGGGKTAVSLDEEIPGEHRPRVELVDERTADGLYEQQWALTLLSRVRDQLVSEYAGDGKADRFAQLETFLPGEDSDMTYAEAAARFGVAEGTIKSDVHRLKRRYRDLLREEIAHTVATPAEIDDELRHLITVLGRPRG